MIWLVKHPCDPSIKREAQEAGCRVVDIRFASSFSDDQVSKVIDGKKKPRKKKAAKTEGE